jgi:hypothetical protein
MTRIRSKLGRKPDFIQAARIGLDFDEKNTELRGRRRFAEHERTRPLAKAIPISTNLFES